MSRRDSRCDLWRAVEAWHLISTTPGRQHSRAGLLEQLLEQSKPPLPVTAGRHAYLLSTPLATSPWPAACRLGEQASGMAPPDRDGMCRSRLPRWRFLMDSDGLQVNAVCRITVSGARRWQAMT
jgi:hypothetical protein